MSGMLALGLRLWRFVDDALPALLVAFTCVMVTLDVLLRNAFGQMIPNGIELSTNAFVWLVFLGAAGASRRGLHFQVDILSTLLGARALVVQKLFVEIACLAVSAVMARTAWDYMMRSWHRMSEALDIPLAYIYLVFPVAFGMMTITHLVRTVVLARSVFHDE